MLIQLILFFLLIALNALFVAAEFSIVKVRNSQLSLEPDSLARNQSLHILKNINLYLTSTQVGVTMASIALGWIGEEIIVTLLLSFVSGLGISLPIETLHAIAIPVSFLLITFLHIVLGELLPKSLALREPLRTILRISVPLKIFSFLFTPFIYFLNGFTNFLLRIMKISPDPESSVLSEKELRLLVEESRTGGSIGVSEEKLLNNVFDFQHQKVKSIMVPHVHMSMLCIKKSIEDASTIVLKEGYSRYPVYNESKDDVVGIALAKDVLKMYIEAKDGKLSSVVKQAFYIHENQAVSILLEEFKSRKLQMSIVTDDRGASVGLITLEDVLEELVGDIQDEWDEETPIVVYVENTQTYQVLANAHINDVNRFLKFPIANEKKYQTLAGALTDEYNSELQMSVVYAYEGYHITILKMKNGFPELLQLTRPVAAS